MQVIHHPAPFHSTTEVSKSAMDYCATIGFFDGVHRGHCFLLNELKQAAAARGMQSMVITFGQHPRCALQTDYRPLMLTTTEHKLQLIENCGIDVCVVLYFDEAFSRLTARQFMQQYLFEALQVRCLLIGHDHRFGCNRSDGFEQYRLYGDEMGIEVLQAPALSESGITCSSSAVRRLLEAGEVRQAAQLLDRPYSLCGMVVEGRRVGRQLGFPTANLRPVSADLLIPANGVYAVRAEVDGQCYGAMLNIGRRPTLNNGNDCTIEAHLFHFSGNLYGKSLCLHFVERLRDEQRFDSIDALRAQLCVDARMAQQLL